MRHQHLGLAAVASALALLAACAGGIPLRESQQEERDRFAAYSGEPVNEFTWFGRYDGWQPIGRDNPGRRGECASGRSAAENRPRGSTAR